MLTKSIKENYKAIISNEEKRKVSIEFGKNSIFCSVGLIFVSLLIIGMNINFSWIVLTWCNWILRFLGVLCGFAVIFAIVQFTIAQRMVNKKLIYLIDTVLGTLATAYFVIVTYSMIVEFIKFL